MQCQGLPIAAADTDTFLEWYKEEASSKNYAAQLMRYSNDSGRRVPRSKQCTGLASVKTQSCEECRKLWLYKSQKGKVYNTFVHWRARRRLGGVKQQARSAISKHSRRMEKQNCHRELSTLALSSIDKLSPSVQQLVTKASMLLADGHMTEEDMQKQLMNLNNVWRKGAMVHGRRYPPELAGTALAIGTVVARRNCRHMVGMLAANAQLAIPGRLTVSRRNTCPATCTFGLQPIEVFQADREWSGQPLHVCCDEIAVNQLIDHIPVRGCQAVEIAGLSNRCVREKNPDGFQYLLKQDGGLLIHKTTVHEGEVSVSEVQGTVASIEDLARIPPATLLCVWIIFEPVRAKKSMFVAAVPTCGDLTTTDDAVMLHNVIKRAHTAGHVVSFYGADNASPHASLARGIIRRLSSTEVWALKSMVDKSDMDLSGEPHIWEPLALSLVHRMQRPVSVMQSLLHELASATGTMRQRAATVMATQWSIPYNGLPYGFQRCSVTGKLLGISCEWRHDNRLMVSVISLLSVCCISYFGVTLPHKLISPTLCRPSTFETNWGSY